MTHVAESGDAVIGFVSMIRVTEPVPALELTSLYVSPSDFLRGVGSAGPRERSFVGYERHP